MASVKNIEFQSYCDNVYHDLNEMKSRLLGFVKEIEQMKGPGKEMVASHVPHFHDIVRIIDWKLEILTKVCPFEWAGDKGIERTASVRVDDELSREQTLSGGYAGG